MSRLMTVDRRTGETGDHIFHDIVDMLSPGDILVINEFKGYSRTPPWDKKRDRSRNGNAYAPPARR